MLRLQHPGQLVHLFHVYGRVTQQVLYEWELKVQQMVYDLQHPINWVFTPVDDLVNFSEVAQTPYTQAHCINQAYRILNRTGKFQRWIIDWNKWPQIQKNRINFKLHFCQVHHQLKETTNFQTRDSSYHANALQEILQEIRSEIQTVKNTTATTKDLLPSLTSTSDISNYSPISVIQYEVANLKDYINNLHQ